MSENINKKDLENLETDTTGHVWDGDLQEYNNPLPRWWLYAFYGTIIFAIGYWILFPTWPLPNTFTKGVYKVEIERPIVQQSGDLLVDVEDADNAAMEKVKVHWNTRTRLVNELQFSKEAELRHKHFSELMTKTEEEIINDPNMIKFAENAGRTLFVDNCATCHGPQAEGVIGLYPNLNDDNWIWGGSLANIEETITKGINGKDGGRRSNMTAGKLSMTPAEIEDVAKYALSLSNNYTPDDATSRGEELFFGKGACFTCHVDFTKDPRLAQGNPLLGAPNLTDQIWEIIDINSMETEEEKVAALIPQIRDGVDANTTNRVMPRWETRLSPEQIRALAVYVHQLGGGKTPE
ncbi:c-type cytochrome [Ignatzschineria rhizosphaerae]|uniref:Cbb3-type cytochrome c oxidase subunit n=1 Tax=Ignatzschineria rhizosphaerae TaxID=2923279 RepID=A0ABY3X812_9GAMM|nr:cbb3-type cytochrome c oxidase N-terminal domain-containing protein [Ignatzschineria rhizosphaerae]UNM96871.1 c-type cytochrome [Ignatzschineria rhizosphaerae]